jgi:hypothetical protein
VVQVGGIVASGRARTFGLRKLWIIGVAGLAVAAVAVPATVSGASTELAGGNHGGNESHGAAGRGGRLAGNMIYHGGKIMPTAAVTAIFWGPSWSTSAGDKISGIDSFYKGFNGSNYAATSDEYTDTVSPGHQVTAATSYAGHLIDPSTASGGASTSVILTEVAKEITNPDPNGYYPVYTDVPRGRAGYCAWHSSGPVNGVTVQFAFFFRLDGDSGCDPADTSGQHSQGLAALGNVSAHELSEARSDPVLNAWYDSQGAENGDKCAWTFGAPLVSFTDGSKWKLQGEWSNAAYTAGTGYPNSSGQKGCLAGS